MDKKNTVAPGEFDPKELLKQFERTQELPKNEKDIGRTILAMYMRGVQALKPWHNASNLYRKYYKGDRVLKKAKFQANTKLNVILSNVEIIKPVLESAMVKPGIFATRPDDTEQAQALEYRTAQEWKESGMQTDYAARLLHGILIDGSVYLKIVYDERARVILIDDRRIVFDPDAASFDESLWIADAVLGSVGETKFMFKGKSPEPAVRELATKEGASTGPPPHETGAIAVHPSSGLTGYVETVGGVTEYATGSPFFTSLSSDIQDAYQKSERVLRIEMWVRDLAQGKNKELLYPNGRIVTIGVGATAQNSPSNMTDPEILILNDIQNPYTTLYKRSRRFPFVQIQCHDVGDICGLSEIFSQLATQDMIIDVLNAIHDNFKLNNNCLKIVHRRSGITQEQLTNEPGKTIFLETDLPPSEAIFTERPPFIAGHMLPVLDAYLRLNERASGVADVIAGRKPAGVTAGVAIENLQDRADNKFLFVARNINNAFIRAYTALACALQDFDEGTTYIPVEDFEEGAEPEEQFIEHNAAQVKSTTFRAECARQMKQVLVIQLLQLVAKMDEAVPGLGGLALEYSEDKRLRNMYKQLRDNLEKKMAEQQKAAMEAQAQQQENEMAKALTLEKMKADNSSKKVEGIVE